MAKEQKMVIFYSAISNTSIYVVELVSVLQQGVQQTQAKPKSENSAKKTRAARRKKAA